MSFSLTGWLRRRADGAIHFGDLLSDAHVFPKQPGEVTWAEFATAAAGGLIWTNLVVLWRTMTR